MHSILIFLLFLVVPLAKSARAASRADENCPPTYLSCATISEASVCCPVNYTCGHDDAGAVACCEFRAQCRGVVGNATSGSGNGHGGGGDQGNKTVGQIVGGDQGGVVGNGGGGVGGFVQSTGTAGRGRERFWGWVFGVAVVGGWVGWG